MPRGKRRITASPPVREGDPFKDFARAASALYEQHREAVQQLDGTGLPADLKKSLQDELTAMLKVQILGMCTASAPAAARLAPKAQAPSPATPASPEAQPATTTTLAGGATVARRPLVEGGLPLPGVVRHGA